MPFCQHSAACDEWLRSFNLAVVVYLFLQSSQTCPWRNKANKPTAYKLCRLLKAA